MSKVQQSNDVFKKPINNSILTMEYLHGQKVFISCASCLTTYSELLNNATYYQNKYSIELVPFPELADAIIVVGCQVTDLAILNNFQLLRKYRDEYNAEVYLSGCAARRFDIELPIERIDLYNEPLYKSIFKPSNKNAILWERPFWVKELNTAAENSLKDGEFLRNNIPFLVSRGCTSNCEYCTIKKVVGTPRKRISTIVDYVNTCKEAKEKNTSVVLVADTLTADDLLTFAPHAVNVGTQLSVRNVEPHNLLKMKNILHNLADRGLLDVVHCPIQSDNEEVLQAMNRSYKNTIDAISLMLDLKEKGVKIATNIIIDYQGYEDKNTSKSLINKFNHVAWNPHWNGIWNEEYAIQRMHTYIELNKGYIQCN